MGASTNLCGIEDNTAPSNGKGQNVACTQLYAQRSEQANQWAMKGLERVADVIAHDQIGNIVEFRRLAIDDDERCAVSLGHQRETRRRPHHQRRADGEKQITSFWSIPRRVRIASAGICWPNEIVAVLMWPPHRAIGRALARSIEFFLDPRQFVSLCTIEAQGISRVAVQFHDIGRGNARSLMQIVDVLRDQRRTLAGTIETRQGAMPAAGLRARETLLHGEAPPPGFVPHLLARQKSHRTVIGLFFVQMPPGERKSGIPHSVEIPAPVKGTMTEAFSISCAEARWRWEDRRRSFMYSRCLSVSQ